MPHRNHKDLDQLDESLHGNSATRDATPSSVGTSTALMWTGQPVLSSLGANNRSVQEKLVHISQKHQLGQVHEEPTREDSHLDLVFSSNPSLIKSSTNIPGLSDHDAVITDSCIKPYHTAHKKPKKFFRFGKADWDSGNLCSVGESCDAGEGRWRCRGNVDCLQDRPMTAADNFIPSAMSSRKHRLCGLTSN